MSRRVYLDHNATSPVRPEARAALDRALGSPAANPSSIHLEGRVARAALEAARAHVSELMGVLPKAVVFTSGGSEGIAAAIHGVSAKAPRTRRRVLVGSVEHSAVLDGARLMTQWGFVIEEAPCDGEGRVQAAAFAERIGDDVALVALQWANNETGVVQPVEEVAELCRDAGAPFLVDAVQAAGKLPLWPRGFEPDLMVISGHKIGGPQGTGALAVRDDLSLAPLIAGGAQERRRRGGTEAVAALAGFGAAAEAALRGLDQEAARLRDLRARLEATLRGMFADVRIHGEGAPRLPNTTSFSVPGVPGETLVIALDVLGFALSTGSACAAGSVKPSHVLLAMGHGETEARGAARVSLGWSTTEEDIERFLDALLAVVQRARAAAAASA